MLYDKHAFFEFALQQQALRFGEFTLKSGRTSPYFFNAGQFQTGQALATLGRFYAQTIIDAGIEFDVIFGPAYKGIPLAATTAIALADHFQRDVPYCFNRKEVKDHGEGGLLVGAPLKGRVLLVDDVITAGTAIREAAQLIEQAGAQLSGIIISLDRQEKGQGEVSAVQEVSDSLQTQVLSIANLADLLAYLADKGELETSLTALQAYQRQYAVES